MRFLQNLADNGSHALDVSGAFAISTWRAKRSLERLLDALTCNRDQTKIVELENFVWGAIGAHALFEREHYFLPVLALIHVDEIDDDDAAEIAQPDLTNNLFDRIGIDLDDRVFEPIRLTDIFACVDVDRHKGFGLVDDDIAAGLEPHLRAKRFFNFSGHAEFIEDRVVSRVQLDAADQRRLEALH